jgi:hypothetical protein
MLGWWQDEEEARRDFYLQGGRGDDCKANESKGAPRGHRVRGKGEKGGGGRMQENYRWRGDAGCLLQGGKR